MLNVRRVRVRRGPSRSDARWRPSLWFWCVALEASKLGCEDVGTAVGATPVTAELSSTATRRGSSLLVAVDVRELTAVAAVTEPFLLVVKALLLPTAVATAVATAASAGWRCAVGRRVGSLSLGAVESVRVWLGHAGLGDEGLDFSLGHGEEFKVAVVEVLSVAGQRLTTIEGKDKERVL